MKVALLASGNSIHAIRWANGLADNEVEVHLITQHPLQEAIDNRVRVTEFRNRGTVGYFSIVPAVRRLLRRIRPDVLSAHYASGYGTTARLVGFHPWMLSVWGSDVYDFPERTPIHRWWVRRNLEAADSVASTSHCMAAQTRLVAPAVQGIAITPFGVDTELFSVPSVRKDRCGETTPLVVGTVKRLWTKYGVDTLIRAFALLRDDLKSQGNAIADRLRLRIVGDGPERDALERLAVELDVAQITQFVGDVPHQKVPGELAQLDIYVALSRLDSESFGVAVLEAGAAGCPVVVSDAGGLPEVVLPNETGLIVPRNDPRAAAGAIRKLVEDPQLCTRLGRSGTTHVAEKYGWPVCLETMRDALEKTRQLAPA